MKTKPIKARRDLSPIILRGKMVGQELRWSIPNTKEAYDQLVETMARAALSSIGITRPS